MVGIGAAEWVCADGGEGDFGDGLPLLSPNAVDFWRDLLADTSKFDFTEIPYDVLGHIFENLLSPDRKNLLRTCG